MREVKQNKGESRKDYLLRVAVAMLEENAGHMDATIIFDEVTCDAFCLIEDLKNASLVEHYRESNSDKPTKAAQKMLEALQNLENDSNQIPPHAWSMVQEAIACALGGKNKALNIADVIASAEFEKDLEKAIEEGNEVGYNSDGGYNYYCEGTALRKVLNVIKKHLL